MCGFVGIVHKDVRPVEKSILQLMNQTLTHRGPDESNISVKSSFGFAHSRLNIIDPELGHQPMQTKDGRYSLVYNGEIYNFQELKKELEKEGIQFSTNSDTEILLELISRDGPDCLKKLNGMFAFACWDHKTRSLFLARDRIGKKPLYYWDHPHLFSFASECKAFLKHPLFQKEIDFEALNYYFQYEYVPEPFCIFKGVKKLKAGHYLIWHDNQFETKSYWNLNYSKKTELNFSEAQNKIVELLDDSVSKRLISDVALGAFLSGGIDSSSIVAMMAKHKEAKDIKTFSIGFDEKSYDESNYANLVAKYFNTDHHHQILTPKKLLQILPEVVSKMDEPFADYSILPTYLLSQFTKEKVTVALSGDGADEFFGGYPTFYAGLTADRFNKSPSLLRNLVQLWSKTLSPSDKDLSFEFKLKQFLYGAHFPQVLRNQVWLGSFHSEEQNQLFLNSTEIKNSLHLVTEELQNCDSKLHGDQMLYFYEKFYLTNDILVKTDRASMMHSLEVRAPFLDYRLMEFATTLPFEWKVNKRQTKYILKKALKNHLPHKILNRAKKGFGVPLSSWFRNELRSKVQTTLNRDKIKQEKIFNPKTIENLVESHLSGKKNNRKQLFSLLMFEWWYDEYFN